MNTHNFHEKDIFFREKFGNALMLTLRFFVAQQPNFQKEFYSVGQVRQAACLKFGSMYVPIYSLGFR